MAKKKEVKKGQKIPKSAKVGLWVLGILVGVVLVTFVGLKIWVSTWKVYDKNGFILRVPASWHVKDLTEKADPDGRELLLAGDARLDLPMDKTWPGNYRLEIFDYPNSNNIFRDYGKGPNFTQPWPKFSYLIGVQPIKYQFSFSPGDQFQKSESYGLFLVDGSSKVCQFNVENFTENSKTMKYFLGNLFFKLVVISSYCK